MQRFFVDPHLLQNSEFELPRPIANQLVRVLRSQPGERISLLDDSGWEYVAAIKEISQSQVRAYIIDKVHPEREPDIRITLYQALVRESKFDWILQKGTELGVSSFIPIITERSLTSAPVNKYPRWRRIIVEAAEQSGRTRLPKLEPALTLKQACQLNDSVRFMAAIGSGLSLRQLLPQARPLELHLFIGPEGGFSTDEQLYAKSQGIQLVELGKRILRTETAGPVASALILYHYNDI
ncbi:MAG: 16S rRNA (uracil(1498)-N(3))-methyltransferase [Anaerolineae bacterium]